MRIAGLRDSAAPSTGPTRVFRGHEAEKRHELTRMTEPSDVADLDDEADGGDKRDATQGLEGLDARRPARGRRDLAQLVGEPLDTAFGVIDRVAIFLQRDVLRRQRDCALRPTASSRARTRSRRASSSSVGM